LSTTPVSEALQLLLRELTSRFPPEVVDRIWVFAPREIAGRESGLVVLSLTEAAAVSTDDRRQLVTWRYEAARERGKLRRVDTIAEQGWAPRDRIPRLIEGVLARLGETAETPLMEEVRSDPRRWSEFLRSMGIAPVDLPYEE
jgi:hypothetical protein